MQKFIGQEEGLDMIVYENGNNLSGGDKQKIMLADMYIEEKNYETAILFLETEIQLYELFMEEEGSYADRAYAGKAYRISELYKKTDCLEKAALWYEKAKKHTEIYKKNPSMLLASMKYCGELEGRMIDSYGEVLDQLVP